MARTRPPRRERLAAALLALLAVTAVLGGVSGVGLADDADHVTRNGDTLTIRLGDHSDDGVKEITVAVEGGGETTERSDDGNATDTFEVPVENVSAPRADLSSANVTVKIGGESVIEEEEVDLRLLRFDAENASFSGGTLEIPLTKALGYADGGDASVTLDGDAEPVDGQIRYRDDGAVLAASFDASRASVPLPETVTIRASDRFETQVALRELATDATTVSKLDDTFVVTHPFVAAAAEYDLVVSTADPNGTYASAVQADENGSLAVTDAALANAEEWTVSVYHHGEPLVEGRSASLGSSEPLAATVESNGTAVNLTGESFDDAEATVWLDNSTRLVRFTAPVENGSLRLGATDYRLDENGSYQLLVVGQQYVRANVFGEAENDTLYAASDDGAANQSDDGPWTDIVEKLGPFSAAAAVVASVVLLLFGAVGVGMLRGGRRRSSGAGTKAGTAPRQTHTVTVVVKDAATDALLDGTVTAVSKGGTAGGSRTSRQVEIADGRESLALEPGEWELTVESHGVTETTSVGVRRTSQVPVTVGPKDVEVTVTDDDGRPLSDIAVTCTPDEGSPETRRTGDDGGVRIPVAVGATEVELSADHEKYDGDAVAASFDGEMAVRRSLTLRRTTGDLEVTASVDGTPVAGLPVEIRPREESIRELGGERETATTDERGVVAFEDRLVGRYQVQMEIPDGNEQFSTQSKRVRIRDGERTPETLDATFEYGLGRNQRDRIETIRRSVEALDSATGRDVAIPRYYGSVVNDLLDAVERVSDEGHRFATADVDPDAVVDALLDAAESAVELVDDAMTSKRNTDLFGACADMPDVRVEWEGRFDAETLFELLAEDRTTQRQTILQRLRKVDDRIDDERTNLAVVSPARELWEGVREFVNSDRGDDRVRGAAVAFVGVGLLGAADELFDHERLRQRLERTVF